MPTIDYRDPAQQTKYNEKAINLRNWNQKVLSMEDFQIPERYEINNTKNKYYRFTGFIRNWVEELLATAPEGDAMDDIHDQSIKDSIQNLYTGRTELMSNWWDVAKKVAMGKAVENNLPKFHEVTDEKKQHVYDTFLPAYRALKENFDKRSIFEFIFNHRQYTAERDSLRALEGIMATLTGDSKESIQTRLDEYVAEIPSTDLAVCSRVLRERIERQMDEQGIEMDDKSNDSIEMENYKEDEKEEIQEVFEDEIAKESTISVQSNNEEKFRENWENDVIKEEFTKQVTDILKNNTKLPAALHDLFAGVAYEKLINEVAFDFNKDMDEAIKNGPAEDLDKAMMNGVKNIFAEAFVCTEKVPGISLKDRIILAQKLSNVTLNLATPAGFQKEAFGRYADGYMIKNTGAMLIKEIVTEKLGENSKFSEQDIIDQESMAINEYIAAENRSSIVVDDVKESIASDERSQRVEAPDLRKGPPYNEI